MAKIMSNQKKMSIFRQTHILNLSMKGDRCMAK